MGEKKLQGFRERLRKARENMGLTQIEVERVTLINNKTLSGYERGKSEPDIVTLSKLASLYDVSLDWLINGETFNTFIKARQLEKELSNAEDLLARFSELAKQIKN